MPANFPNALDDFPDGQSGVALGTAHLTLHNDINAAVEALEAKVGVDGSLVATSLDYKLRHRVISAKPSNYTVTALDGGSILTNEGAAGTVTLTLPASPDVGFRVGFYVFAAKTLRVTPNGAHNFVSPILRLGGGESLESDRVGAYLEVIFTGTSWRVVSVSRLWRPSAGGLGLIAPTTAAMPAKASVNASITTEQTVSGTNFTVPAASLSVGTQFKIHAGGTVQFGFGEMPSLTLRVKGASGALVDTGALPGPGGVAPKALMWNADSYIATVGVSGVAEASWFAAYNTLNHGTPQAALNTTADLPLALTAQFGSGGTSATVFTVRSFTVEVL